MTHSLSPRRYHYDDFLHLNHSWGSGKVLVYTPSVKVSTTQLEVEIQRLTNHCSQLTEENRRLLRENENLLHEIRNLRETRVVKGSDTNVIANLTEENLRLSDNLASRIRELDDWKVRYNSKIDECRAMYKREIDEWKARYSRLELSMSTTIAESQYMAPAPTVTVQNCDLCVSEINQLNTYLLERDITIKDLKMKLELKQEPKMTVIKHDDSSLRTKIEILTADNKELNRFLSERESDIRALRVRIDEVSTLQASLRDMEIKLKAVVLENEKLRVQPVNEVVVVKKIKDISLEKKFAAKSEKVEELKHIVKDMTEKIAMVTELEAKLVAVTQERDKKVSEKTKLLTERAKEIEVLKIKVKTVEEEREKVLKEKNDLIKENQKLEKDISKKKKKKKSLKAKIKEYEDLEKKLNIMSMEKERLNHMVSHNESQVKSYKSEIENLKCELEKIGELKLRIASMSEDSENWKVKIKEKEEKIAVLSAQVSEIQEKLTVIVKEKEHVAHEKDKLNIILADKTREIDLLKFEVETARESKNVRFEAEKEALRVIFEKEKEGMMHTIKLQEEGMVNLKKQQTAKVKKSVSSSTIKKTSIVETAKKHELEKYTDMMTDLKYRLSMSTTENERLMKILNEKQNDMEYVRRKLDDIGTGSLSVRGERSLTRSATNVYYLDNLSGMRTKYSGLSDDSDILRMELVQLRSEMQTLKSQVNQVPLSESVVRSSYESRDFRRSAPLEKLAEVDHDHSFGVVSEVRTAASSQFSPFTPISSISPHSFKNQLLRESKY